MKLYFNFTFCLVEWGDESEGSKTQMRKEKRKKKRE